jgi:hypothetical protein
MRLFFLLIVLLMTCQTAWAASPVGVLKSLRNVTAYGDQHLGNFDDDWAQLVRTLGAANIRYEEISDPEVAMGQQRIGNYKLWTLEVPPLLVHSNSNNLPA